MQTVLNEIAKLRNGIPIVIDYSNSNRYRLVVQENNGTKTAYCFSTPIYNAKTRKLVDMKFHKDGDTICAVGSNASITLSQNLVLENAEVSVSLRLPEKPTLISPQQTRSGSCVISPTTNGVAIRCDLGNSPVKTFSIDVGRPHFNVRANDRCFALMKEEFRPLVVLSCLGSLDAYGNIIASARIEYQKLTDRKYQISISATSPLAQAVLFEMNLYENKLFQDTTVESANPWVNNAFGSIGFIGNSDTYGEQWLYSRLDYSRISEMMDKRVHKVVLHIPKLNQSNAAVSAFKLNARFCSFGSNWNNKMPDGSLVANSTDTNGYQSLDITDWITKPHSKTISNVDGFILKSKTKGSGFSALATGDSYFAPQILEINYQ